ncbi:O-antigen ligase family protein [Spongiibacter marinus]|uniref:O-antigen ligase family protein n=1 Tax=Spongiibacter marinus TaxID=354246 RepID=UPI0006876097|nr:capsular biosynthesis protein [Spongiibacter marinus]
MEAQAITPNNIIEKWIWYALILTYPFYVLGAVYIVAPVLGWLLLGYWAYNLWLPAPMRARSIQTEPHPVVILWIAGMLVMEVALVFGHFDFYLGIPATIKSTIGWAKGWALLAVFILIGATLPIRPELIYRACCVICLHTLLLIPLFVIAAYTPIPGTIYISPLKAIGGPGPEFFEFQLYGINPESLGPRWRFFTPWAPAAGLLANFYLVFALKEKNIRWRWIGIVGSIAMVLMCQSRAGLVAMLFVSPAVFFISRLNSPALWLTGGVGLAGMAVIATQLMAFAESSIEEFKAARAGSSRVRAALARIALQRWRDEAPIWGHGVVERGPHLVEYMPIGSHHSWYGLLFVKGIVGFFALAIPMLVTFVLLIGKAQRCATSQAALCCILILFMFSFGENLEILAYLFWPALVLIGIAFRSDTIAKTVDPNQYEKF